MSLAIGTNTSALFAQGSLRSSQSKTATSMERLSTGLRVNSAKDDAAGMAIGERMTAQIRGLDQAVRNIHDGISLLQTAEGGLSSITETLQRLRELAVQSANDTYSEEQRGYMQMEAAALQGEISEIADTTTWNGMKLLNGTFVGAIQMGANADAGMTIVIPAVIGSAPAAQPASATTGTVSVSVSPGSVAESGSTSLSYTFTRSGDTSSALSVNIGVGGTASAADYTSNIALATVVASSPTWTKLLGTSDRDLAYATTTGLDGSIYVAGYTGGALDGQTPNGWWDTFLTKYSADGTKVWTRLLGSSGSDPPHALTTGLDGSIYVSGMTNGALDGQNNSGGLDAYLTKYSADGTKVWTKLLGTSGSDWADSLTTGLDGSIYVSGMTSGSLDGQNYGGEGDAFLTKFSADGTMAWTRLLGSVDLDWGHAVTTGLDGSIYVSGYAGRVFEGQATNGGSDAFLTKYSADGTKAWTRLLGSSGSDSAKALTTGLDGSIYVSGSTYGALDGQTYSGGSDVFLTKYSADGTKVWTKQLGTSAGEGAHALTTGLDGSIFVSGYTNGALDGQSNLGYDAFLTKYSADGTKAWTKLLGSSNEDSAQALTTGLDGSIYVSGYTEGAFEGQSNSGGFDAFLTKFAAVGPQITFAAGSATATLVVTPTADGLVEGSETLAISVLAGSGYTADAGVASATIVDGSAAAPAPITLDLSTSANATSAIAVIDSTLNTVSSTRATLGSYINRLSYAADNAANTSMNLAASRSAIMDTDYALETTNLAKNQIVQQAATAMLAQANQQPQAVLELLKHMPL